MTNDHDRPTTPDERRAMDWWNALTDQQRRDLMKNADTRILNPSAAEAWNLLIAGEISGPPLPPGAKPIELPPGNEWRRRPFPTAADRKARLEATLRPTSKEEARLVEWLAGWDNWTTDTLLVMVERLRREEG